MDRCRNRWSGEAFKDARHNFADWRDLHETLEEQMHVFKRNPGLRDMNGKYHNPSCTLTDFLWKLQESLTPDKSCLSPLLDFEEYFQKVFLRRGLIIYCSLLLEQMKQKSVEQDERQLELPATR